ncbi:unnamed protein product, partial [Trichobilharzia szidati]
MSGTEFDWRDDESREIESDVTDWRVDTTPAEGQLMQSGDLESDAGYPDIDSDSVLRDEELDEEAQEQEGLDTRRDGKTSRSEASTDMEYGGEPDSDILENDQNELVQRGMKEEEKKKKKGKRRREETERQERGYSDDERDHEAPPYTRIPGEISDVGEWSEDEVAGGQVTPAGWKQTQEPGEPDSSDVSPQVHRWKKRRHPDAGGEVPHPWRKQEDSEENSDESGEVLGDRRRRLTEWDVTDSEEVGPRAGVHGRGIGATREADIVKTDSKLDTYRERMKGKEGRGEGVVGAGEAGDRTDERNVNMPDSEDVPDVPESLQSYDDSQHEPRKRAYQEPVRTGVKRKPSTAGCRHQCGSETSYKSQDTEERDGWKNNVKRLSEVPIHRIGGTQPDGLHKRGRVSPYTPETDNSDDDDTGS